MMTLCEPNQLGMRDQRLGADPAEMNLTTAQQVGQRAEADRELAGSLLAVVEEAGVRIRKSVCLRRP